MSNSCPQGRQNWHDNVFAGLLVGAEEASLVAGYLAGHDFSAHTRRAIRNDLRKFARWFTRSQRGAVSAQTGDAPGCDRLSQPPASGAAAGGRQHQSCLGLDSPILRLARSAGSRWTRIRPSRSRSFVVSRLHRRIWIGPMCDGCFERSNCGRTFRAGAIFQPAALHAVVECRMS